MLTQRRQEGLAGCPICEQEISIAPSYSWHTSLLALITVLVLAVFTYNPQRHGAWLLCLILILVPAKILFIQCTSPWFIGGERKYSSRFLACYLTAVILGYAYQFVGLTGAYLALGASRSELQENLELTSLPVAWFFPQFLITRQSAFLDICGVILTNAFFFAGIMYFCWTGARSLLLRNRVTRIGLSPPVSPDDKD